MPPRNLTWDEEVQDKMLAINKMKLKLRNQRKEVKRFCQQKQFLEELVCRYVDKIVRIRERDNLHALEVTLEISGLQWEVAKMEDDINEFSIKMQNASRKEAEMDTELYYLKEDLRHFFRNGAV